MEAFSVRIAWPENTSAADKASWMMQVQFSADVPWVQCPPALSIFNETERTISIGVDARNLPPGIHFGLVTATQATNPAAPVLRVPISVFKALQVGPSGRWRLNELALEQGTPPFRVLLDPPVGATHYVVTMEVRSLAGGTPRLLLATNHLSAGKRESNSDLGGVFALVDPGQVIQRGTSCSYGQCVELVLMVHPVTPGQVILSLEVQFCSFVTHGAWGTNGGAPSGLLSDTPCLVAVKNFLAPQKTALSASCKKLLRSLRPTSSSAVTELPIRYQNFGSVQPLRQAVVSFAFSIEEPALTVSLYSALDESTYAYAYQSLLLLYTSQNEYVHCWGWGGFNSPSSQYGTTKLTRGSYVAHVVVRHENQKMLEALAKRLTLTMEIALDAAVTLPFYRSLMDATTKDKKVSLALLASHATVELWTSSMAGDLPAVARTGDVLVGTLTFATAPVSLSAPLSMVVQSAPASATTTSPAASAAPVAVRATRVKDAELAAAIAFFASGAGDVSAWLEEARRRFEACDEQQQQQALDLLCVMLDALARKPMQEPMAGLIAEGLKRIDQDELARHFGTNAADKAVRAAMVAKRASLVKLLTHRVGLCAAGSAELTAATADLARWSDAPAAPAKLTDTARLHAALSAIKASGGVRAVPRTKLDEVAAAVDALGWSFWKEQLDALMFKMYPSEPAFSFAN